MIGEKKMKSGDLISRQAAISLPVKPKEDRYFRTCNLDDAYEYGWSDLQGCIKSLPSAQPEIIRCRDCKYAEVADPEDSQDGYSCQFHRGSIWFSGSYCSWAERREG